MIAVALKGLLGRKTRAILTSLAIVLGVAMVSGTFVLTDTVQKAFNSVFTSSYQHTSVIVSGKEVVSDAATAPTVPASLLPKIRTLPDVDAAAGGFLFDTVELIRGDGKAIGGRNAPQFGFGLDPTQPRFNPITLTSGSWAAGPHQVVIDAGTASAQHYKLGDTIAAKADGPIRRYTISGIGKLGGVSLGDATMAAFDVPTAQAILGKRGRFDSISVAASPGVSPERLAAEIRPLLPATTQAKTAAQEAQSGAAEVDQGINRFRAFLLAFAGIALFVGAFVIFNTISITVAQRTRELATLRTLGASRRQVLRSVLLESSAIGVLASLIGLGFGLALAKGLNAIFVAVGIDLPKTGMVLAPRTVIVSLLVGTSVTLLAALFPALRATRVPAISAVREGATLPRSRHSRYRPVVAGAVVTLALAAIAKGLFASNGAMAVLLPLAVGTLLLFLGVALVSSHLIRPLAAVVGQPARRLGGNSGRLAAENAIRNPGRTAATAAALMIGLALVTFVATLGAGLRSSLVDSLDRQLKADYIVSGNAGGSWGRFPAAAGHALQTAPGVTLASSVRDDQARVFGESTDVAGVNPRTIGHVYKFEWDDGSDGLLAKLGDRALVTASYAKDHHLRPGSRLSLETSAGARLTFVVAGTYKPPSVEPIFSGIVISQTAFDRSFPQPQNEFTFIDTNNHSNRIASLKRTLGSFPDVTVRTTGTWIERDAHGVDTILDVLYVLLALSVLVSLFGMINTLVLSVFERTRELGMLRAIGMTRVQTRRMVRHESIITAAIGAALGLPLGLLLAALVTSALTRSGNGIGFHLPLLQLVIFSLVAILAGTLAAILPARRASRLNILEALQYE